MLLTVGIGLCLANFTWLFVGYNHMALVEVLAVLETLELVLKLLPYRRRFVAVFVIGVASPLLEHL